MNPVHLRKVDLNLLVVFDVIMKERSLVAASERLNLSESAVSHALARLRKVVRDRLFVREGNEMQPTRRALELALPVQHALGRIERALSIDEFEPAHATRTFALTASDYTCTLIIPQLLGRFRRIAPGIQLSVVPVSRPDVVRQLETGRIDLAVGWFAAVPKCLGRETLLEETEALVVREGHPLTRKGLTQENFMSYPRVIVDLIGNTEEVVDGFVSERGVRRRVHFTSSAFDEPATEHGRVLVKVPSFASALAIVAASDLIASVPRRLVLRLQSGYGVAVLKTPPAQTPRVAIEVIWHERGAADAGLLWLRQELKAVAGAVASA